MVELVCPEYIGRHRACPFRLPHPPFGTPRRRTKSWLARAMSEAKEPVSINVSGHCGTQVVKSRLVEVIVAPLRSATHHPDPAWRSSRCVTVLRPPSRYCSAEGMVVVEENKRCSTISSWELASPAV